jgi:ABC-type transporter Mla maintaining outer membrane lipid asymmetry ATPase subunit MlaF
VAAVGAIEELLRSQDPWIRAYFHGKRGSGRETAFRARGVGMGERN